MSNPSSTIATDCPLERAIGHITSEEANKTPGSLYVVL
jgi:hypothetical protein